MRARAGRRTAAVGKGPNDNEGALAPRRQRSSSARLLAAACEPRRTRWDDCNRDRNNDRRRWPLRL
jgi:hypothetical protein